MGKDFSPEGISAQARASRDRLCPGKALDLLFLHGPTPDQLTPAMVAALRRLQDAGVVRELGVAGRGAELQAALTEPALGWLMCPVGPSQAEVLAKAAEQGVGVLAIEVLRPSRPRLRLPRQPADLWTLARALRDRTRPPGEAGPGIAAALALPAVRAVLVTTTRSGHLAANARAAGLDPKPASA
jgi:aryl-alcohol dehydrogenase-like predicted oxidoreductase